MNTCETCIFWDDETWRHTNGRLPFTEELDPGEEPWDEYTNHTEVPDYRACTAIPNVERSSQKADIPTEPAVVVDCCDYWSQILTKRDFGCILHQPKEGVS